MAQFDIYRLNGGQLVVELQTDIFGIDASRIVAPLRDAGRYTALLGLTPTVEMEDTTWIVHVQEMVAVPRAELKDHIGSLTEHRDALKRALDILIEGI